MIDETTHGDRNKYKEEKQIEINKIITYFKFNKESLLKDQYNNLELYNKIKNIAKTKGGFLNNKNRKFLWDYLFYKRANKKGIIDLIKINKKIELSISKLNLKSELKKLTEEKLKTIDEYKIILNDLPRTCKNIIENNKSFNYSYSSSLSMSNNNNIMNNKANNNNVSPEIFLFACDKIKYKYLQGLLNIIYYFKKIFNYENCINSLNIYFEYFFKDFLDIELNEENKDENISLISNIILDLYNYLYSNKKSDIIEDYMPVLCNKWIISDFISEIKDMNKGFRLLDYLIMSEPYIKYVLATVLMKKFNSNIMANAKLKLDSSLENIFEELKKDDLNSIDIDEIINEVEVINESKGDSIKKLLNEKYGNKFIYSFNSSNHGLISFYSNLVNIFEIKKPKREIKINIGDVKCSKIYIYCLIGIANLLAVYYIYHKIDQNRYFW